MEPDASHERKKNAHSLYLLEKKKPSLFERNARARRHKRTGMNMSPRRRKRQSTSESASTNPGSDFAFDEDDENVGQIENPIRGRECCVRKLSVVKQQLIAGLQGLFEIDLEAQREFINALPTAIREQFERRERSERSDSFVLQISTTTMKHFFCDLQTFKNRIEIMDEKAQDEVGVLQFGEILVAACSASIGQMFASSVEAQTLRALKLEIFDILKKETLQSYQTIVVIVVNFFQTGALLQFLEEDTSRVLQLRNSYMVVDNACFDDGKKKHFPQIEHDVLKDVEILENGETRFFGFATNGITFKNIIKNRMNALNGIGFPFQLHLRSHAILSLVQALEDVPIDVNIIFGFSHSAAALYEGRPSRYGNEVYEKTNWDVLQEPELRDSPIGPRPEIAQRLGEPAEAAEKKLHAFLRLLDQRKIEQSYVLNNDQIKVAKRMLYEVTRENFASIVNPEPCRSGKTRVTILVILCLLEWIVGADDGKILIISPLTATAAFTETFTSFCQYFHSLEEIKNHCTSDQFVKVVNVKTKIKYVTLQNVSRLSENNSGKFRLVVVDECHEVYTKSQQRQSGDNENQIMEIVRKICDASLLRIFMSGTIVTNGFCDVYWLARLMGFKVGNYEYFYQNFSVVISRIFLTDAMKSRNAVLYRRQALQQFGKLYETFLRYIERVQAPFPTKRFFTFAFQKDVVTIEGEYESLNSDSDTEAYRRVGDDSETPDSSDDDIFVARGGGGGAEEQEGGGGGGEEEEEEPPTNDYDCDRALTHIFQRDPYFAHNFLTMYLKRLHGIVPYTMKYHVENCMHTIEAYLESEHQDLDGDEMEALKEMARSRLEAFERVLQNCSTIILDDSLSATIRVNIIIERILHFVDEKNVKVVVTCDSVEMLHAFARILKEKSESLKAHGDSILFFTSEDAVGIKDRDDIINQFRTDAQSYVLFASQIGSAGVSFAPAHVLIKLDVCYKTHLEEQSSHRCNPLPDATSLNNDGNAEENRVETMVTNTDVSSRVFLNELCAGIANMCGAGRRDGRSFLEDVSNGLNLTLMNRATRQINTTDALDIQQEYLKNLYATCVQKYGNNCLTEKTYGDERQVTMATLHMNEEQFHEVLSETPIPHGAKKEEKIKSVNFQGRPGNDRDGRGGGGGGGGGGGAGRRVRLPQMQTGDSSLGYAIPYSDDDKTVEKSLWGVVESIENKWDNGDDASRLEINNAIAAHNTGAASVEALKIDQTHCEGFDLTELADPDYPLKCKYKSKEWQSWQENIASCSRHDKNGDEMFVVPPVTSKMMIGIACEQTALLALCKQKQFKIVKEFSNVSFMHREYNVSYSPDAVVYSPRDRKLYVVEIKTSSDLKSSSLLGSSHRVKSGRTQLQLGMRLLNICSSGILVDFVLDRTTKRQSIKVEYFDSASIVYTFRNGKRVEKNPEEWFTTCHDKFTRNFMGKEEIEAWRTARSN